MTYPGRSVDDQSTLVNFDRLEATQAALRDQFATAQPFRHVVIDDFADPVGLATLLAEMPDPHEAGIGKSRDYVFAKNKFEKSGFAEFGPQSRELYTELCSDRFGEVLRAITGEDVFVDPAFHGGGMHQAGEDSFLDMHVDFNKHPLHESWFRNLNILLYLNPGWEPAWRGSSSFGTRRPVPKRPSSRCSTAASSWRRSRVQFARIRTDRVPRWCLPPFDRVLHVHRHGRGLRLPVDGLVSRRGRRMEARARTARGRPS